MGVLEHSRKVLESRSSGFFYFGINVAQFFGKKLVEGSIPSILGISHYQFGEKMVSSSIEMEQIDHRQQNHLAVIPQCDLVSNL